MNKGINYKICSYNLSKVKQERLKDWKREGTHKQQEEIIWIENEKRNDANPNQNQNWFQLKDY